MNFPSALTAAFFTAALLWGPVASAAPVPGPEARDIDVFTRKALARIGVVPGLSLAVVRGEEPVITAGFGVANVETGVAVDANTRFYVASATKSFTALAIAAMAARGAVDLDTPVADWAGSTKLPPDIARSITLTDLLSHRSGVENDPIAFRAAMSGDHSPRLMQALLAETVKSADTPHGTFRYTNTGYNLATTLIERRFGPDWRALVSREVLVPAGLTQTTAWVSRARRGGVVAVGHTPGPDGASSPSSLQKVDATMQSAGGLMSSANDMARWLELQINDGVLDDRRVFPAGLVDATHRPRVAQKAVFGPYSRDGYGLGWQTGRYGDDVLIHHFGNFAGSRTHVSFMPGRRLGVAIMANEDFMAGELVDLLADYVYDRFAGRPDLEAHYDAELAALAARRDKRLAGLSASRAERAARPWPLSRPTSAYVGTYVDPAMGRMEISEANGRMKVRIGVMSALAEAFTKPETIRVELSPLQGEAITFAGPDSLVFEGRTFLRATR